MRTPSLEIVVLAAAALLTGCADYANQRDTISLGAGNAMQANMAVHTANAFPPHRNVTAIRSDGQVAERNVRVYRGIGQTAGPAQPAATAPAAPAAE
ncbi:hypothetical protein VSX64_10285 [Aurantimonas sp. C2-6-R+9]|uniref:hypothetical protein n=1 Tax=unclassified Aurantimonas TaxID=2638230 RepID=UPI002E1796CE|nr:MULTISPECIES: hypothetical protein [unclassified Aurantimonas]MEC5290981.1 hypothetical protein [Aurantimonas sp. C2-3-R2]MEC5381264.1 hypothetical protein [Aurantimonas sp. C2-6-R+9]MEC5412086.1 hypothetical protein [Aurantimonas sp. C2-4-R8]